MYPKNKNRNKGQFWLLTFPKSSGPVTHKNIFDYWKPLCSRLITCTEKHDDGTPHVHCYIELKKHHAINFTKLKKLCEDNWDKHCGGMIDFERTGGTRCRNNVWNYCSGMCEKKGFKLNPERCEYIESSKDYHDIMFDWLHEIGLEEDLKPIKLRKCVRMPIRL